MWLSARWIELYTKVIVREVHKNTWDKIVIKPLNYLDLNTTMPVCVPSYTTTLGLSLLQLVVRECWMNKSFKAIPEGSHLIGSLQSNILRVVRSGML